MSKLCIKCGNEIPQARLNALPETDTCVNCSGVKKVKGFNVVEHKTGNWTQIISDDSIHQELVRLDHSKGRARTGYAGAQ